MLVRVQLASPKTQGNLKKMQVDYIQHCGTDLSVVNAARVSFNKESKIIDDKDIKLIKYLSDHEHTSPFNHAFLTVRVKAPIFVARQLVKHKFMPWNEVSRRYVDSDPEFYVPYDWRKRASNVKQGSSDEAVNRLWGLDPLYKQQLTLYNRMLKVGVCPEQARMVLPQSMYTEWYWSGTLGAFLDMLKLRLKTDTQQETRAIAEMIADIVKQYWPESYKAVLKS
jgi:thymidylate synthase (FAD)